MTEVYQRSMRFSYDADRLQSEVANGALGGYDGKIDRSNGMSEDADFISSDSHQVQAHLQDVRWEIACMEEQRNPNADERSELLQLKLDEILLQHQVVATETVEDNPKDTKRLIEALDEHDAKVINYLAKCLIKERRNAGELFVLPLTVSQQEVKVLDEFIDNAPASAAGSVAVAQKVKLYIVQGAQHPAAIEAVLPDELAAELVAA